MPANPIKIETKISPIVMLQKLTLPQALFNWFTDSNFTMVVVENGFSFIDTDDNHKQVAFVPIKLPVLQALAVGTLGTLPKQAVSEGVANVLKKLKAESEYKQTSGEPSQSLEAVAKAYTTPAGMLGLLNKESPKAKEAMAAAVSYKPGQVVQGDDGAPVVTAKQKYNVQTPYFSPGDLMPAGKVTPVAKPGMAVPTFGPGETVTTPFKGAGQQKVEVAPVNATVFSTEKWPVFDVAMMHAAEMVHLNDATKLLQPVFGSSKGSRYFVVAGGQGIRIAARYYDKNLAIRVGGDDLEKYEANIKEAGLDMKHDPQGVYASIHLDVNSLDIARKALGAVIAALDLPIETAPVSIKLIHKPL